ncbi:hypothetical protein IFM89_039424 [Coptis chinensis]|uniref:Protein kinase domain-containing protein n=1 Tax=Coptis chinensis TaxID=261450 RepID=A0A835IKA3_9MAGN|nr:hypothetical protein IFM89_039424 [Coptis chinensis]
MEINKLECKKEIRLTKKPRIDVPLVECKREIPTNDFTDHNNSKMLDCKTDIPTIDQMDQNTSKALAERFALNKSSGDYVIRPPSSGLSKATIDCLRPFFSNLEGDHISIKYGDFLNSRYKVLRVANVGEHAKVLKCVDTLGQNLVVIKVFRGNKGSHAVGVVDMLTLLKLSMHDKGGVNFVQIQNSFMHSKHLCIVYECLGPSLYEFQCQSKNEQLPIEYIRELGRELLQSIVLMHDLHFVHASLSPAHVLFASNYKEDISAFKRSGVFAHYKSPAAVKLIDFASSFFEYADIPCIKSRRPYRAPEVILGLRLSYACDVWSVGCILVELCLGKQLFRTAEDLDHLAMMECVFGKLPQYMLQKAASNAEMHKKKRCIKNSELECSGSTLEGSIETVEKLPKLNELVPGNFKDEKGNFIGLLEGLLKYDPSVRLTARQALGHPFFKFSSDFILEAERGLEWPKILEGP